LVATALQTSRLRGVLGARVFDRSGGLLESMPTTLQLAAPSPQEWTELRAMQPVVRFNPAGSLGGLYGEEADPRELAPLLDITVPLHAVGATALEGAAQYVIDGAPIAQEFTLLDRKLVRQAALVWLLATGVSVAGAGWMIQRLARANAELRARTDDLVQANRELARAAKTSALGALTAHLMHGLRNPIAGLEAYLKEQRKNGSPAPEGEWSEATAAARRLTDMVNEVVNLMHDEHSGVTFELSSREVLETVAARVTAVATRRQVSVSVLADGAGKLTNHQAGLVTAILTNLAQNACEALPAGSGTVALKAKAPAGGELEFTVEDNGPGLPAEIRDRPFEPRQSSKPAGAGIGLAISRQLAAHLGGTLVLTATNSSGTSFSLLLPKTNSPRD
jgi:signal transduction histidine kinase